MRFGLSTLPKIFFVRPVFQRSSYYDTLFLKNCQHQTSHNLETKSIVIEAYPLTTPYMPPHCDTQDGPVVQTARKALETGNVNLILPWVQKDSEEELKKAFEKVMTFRKQYENSQEGMEIANRWFFETAVRLHRTGEGEPFTGIKPAGLDEGPIVPKAEKALHEGNAQEVIDFLGQTLEEEVQNRFKHALSLKNYQEKDVPAARKYVNAMLDFMLFSHKLYIYLKHS